MTDIPALKNNLFFTKKVICCFFLFIVFFVSKTQAITLSVSICTHKDYEFSKNETRKHKCNKEIIDGQKIHIDSVGELMHAAIRVRNLESIIGKDKEKAHERLQIHWTFPTDISQSDTRNFGKEGTFYDSEKKVDLVHSDPNYIIAEDMYKNSSLKIFWSVVEVLVSKRNDYETHSSKEIDENFHIGEWEVKIYEIGKVVNGKKEEIFGQKFEIVK